jgi:hypothetical protein
LISTATPALARSMTIFDAPVRKTLARRDAGILPY